MKKVTLLFFLVLIFNISTLMSQTTENNCACCSEDYNQFNFWLGEWDVYNTSNNLVGTNSISKQYDNCVIKEKWVSVGKNRGTSINFYDKSDGYWHQIWVDNSGYILNLKGKFLNGSMILKSEIIENEKGNYYNQISWTKNTDNTVTQLWEVFSENNDKLSEAFRGIYKKRLN
jgi:hypothetical protein